METTRSTTHLIHLAARAAHHNGSPYGYTPTFWICVLFVVLFSFTTGA